MFQDICFPNGNEKEFVDVALTLGTPNLIFVYFFKNKEDIAKNMIILEGIKKLKVQIGVLVDDKTVDKIPNDVDYVFSKNPSRALIESKKTHILYDFENQLNYDFMHHRNSGLNHIYCNMIKDKKKVLGFSFSSILNSKNVGMQMGRMQQNARLARKYDLKVSVLSFANQPNELRGQHELKSFQNILGL